MKDKKVFFCTACDGRGWCYLNNDVGDFRKVDCVWCDGDGKFTADADYCTECNNTGWEYYYSPSNYRNCPFCNNI